MDHRHIWKRSSRKHRNPRRFFVRCACGVERQAVIKDGNMRVFNTGRKRTAEPMRNYSIRLPRKPTKEEVKYFQSHLRKHPAES